MPQQITINRNHDAVEAYYVNADYDAGASIDLAKATAFRTAVRQIIGYRPQTVSRGGQGGSELVTFNLEVLAAQLNLATTAINIGRASVGGGVRYGTMGDVR